MSFKTIILDFITLYIYNLEVVVPILHFKVILINSYSTNNSSYFTSGIISLEQLLIFEVYLRSQKTLELNQLYCK